MAVEKAKNLVQLDPNKDKDDWIPPNAIKGVDSELKIPPLHSSRLPSLHSLFFITASDLRKKVAVITKDERGYGLTVHSESPVVVQSVKEGKDNFVSCTFLPPMT